MHRFVPSVAVAAAAALAAAAPAPAPADPLPPVGCYRSAGTPPRFVEFRLDRIAWREGPGLRHFHAKWHMEKDGNWRLHSWNWTRKAVWRVVVNPERGGAGDLRLETGREEILLTRLRERPAELELRPHPLGRPAPVAPERLEEIRGELARRVELDQAVRTDPARVAEAPKVDADNTRWLKALVAEVGWIDAKRFGPRAADAAFLIVQHSGDVPLMLAALPEIERDVRAKLLDGQNYALLHDRLQLNLGGRQRYGSQVAPGPDGSLVVLPLENPKEVERLRKEIGIFPLSAYLEFFRAQNGGKVPVPFEWD